MIKLRIEEILREKNITKTAFAELMGVKKQNVNVLLETRNLDRIQEIADKLDVDFFALIEKGQEQRKQLLNGYVEYRENIYKISCKEDLENLLKEVVD